MASRILVVDDDKQIVRLVRSYLEQASMTTYAAYDGSEALRTIRTERPDLIVLDLLLPERDGWEVTRTLRSDERLAGQETGLRHPHANDGRAPPPWPRFLRPILSEPGHVTERWIRQSHRAAASMDSTPRRKQRLR